MSSSPINSYDSINRDHGSLPIGISIIIINVRLLSSSVMMTSLREWSALKVCREKICLLFTIEFALKEGFRGESNDFTLRYDRSHLVWHLYGILVIYWRLMIIDLYSWNVS